MHHPTDMIAHTTAFVKPVVEHWLDREIAQIDGNVELMHRVHLNLTKHFDLCIANGGKRMEDVIY